MVDSDSRRKILLILQRRPGGVISTELKDVVGVKTQKSLNRLVRPLINSFLVRRERFGRETIMYTLTSRGRFLLPW